MQHTKILAAAPRFGALITLAALTVGTSAREVRALTPNQAGPIMPYGASGLCLALGASWGGSGYKVQQATCTGASNQDWYAQSYFDGSYYVRHSDTGMCLSVAGSSLADYAEVLVWPCVDHPNHRFALSESVTGETQLIDKNSGKCIVPYYSSTSSGVDMIQHTCANQPTHKFMLPKPGLTPGQTGRLVPFHSGHCLKPTSNAAGAKVQQVWCDNADDKQWYFEATSDGYNRIRHIQSGLCVDVSGGSSGDNASIILWSCHDGNNQRWKLLPMGGGRISLQAKHSGKCMDTYYASTASGTDMVQFGCGGTPQQKFVHTTRGFFGAGNPTFTTLQAVHSNRCVGVAGDSRSPGARLVQWDCVGAGNQSYELMEIAAGQFALRARHSGLCVAPESWSSADGAKLMQEDCSGLLHQRWRKELVSGSEYKIVNVGTGKAMDVTGGPTFTENGVEIQQWGYGGGTNQRFRLTDSDKECVYFVHGTGDYSQDGARNDYWKPSTIDAMRSGKTYGVAGYRGSTYAADDPNAWGDLVNQMGDFINANACTDVVVIAHSNGSNAVRYLLAHGTAMSPALQGRGARQVSTVTSKIRKTIWLAGDNMGTPLADKVTTAGTFGNIAAKVLGVLGTNYLTPAVYQQVRATMATKNGNGVFNGNGFSCGAGSTCGGVPSQYVAGTGVQAGFWDGDAYCGEGGGFFDKIRAYAISVALKATNLYGGMNGCGDGFLPCDSQRYNGAGLLENGELSHSQSRRDCKGNGGSVAAAVRAAIKANGAVFDYTAVPADYTISQAELACAASGQGAVPVRDVPGASFHQSGCPASSRDNGVVDYDCLAAYGYDEAGSSNPAVAPVDFARSEYASHSCPDSWLGDGVCDLCLVAKYGYDALEGTANGADDCAIPDPITMSCTTDAECNAGVTDPMKRKYYCGAGACQPQSACSDLGADVAGGPITGTYEYWTKH